MRLAERLGRGRLARKLWLKLAGYSKQYGPAFWLIFWLFPYSGQSVELCPSELIRRALAFEEENEKIARNYTFHERTETRTLDHRGSLKSSLSETHDITILDSYTYRRLIARNDQILNPTEAQEEQEKLKKSIARLQKETSAQRNRRLTKWEQEERERRELVAEVGQAFNFQLVGEDCIDGIETYLIDAQPKPSYTPPNKRSQILPKLRGTLWIAKNDYAWIKLNAETIEKVSFGLFLFKLNKGAKLQFEKARVNDEVWLIDTFRIKFKARLFFIKGLYKEFITTFDNFRKFTVSSRVALADGL